MGKMGQTNLEAMRKGRPGRLCEGEQCCDSTCWKVPYIGPERGKLREVNPVSAINTGDEKSGKRRAEARGNSAPLPHMAQSPRIHSGSSRVPGHWEAKSSAVPGHHTAGWANEPRGNKKVIIPPGAHLPNRDMASRHSAVYSLLNGQERVLEHEYAGEVRHMR